MMEGFGINAFLLIELFTEVNARQCMREAASIFYILFLFLSPAFKD